MGKSRGKGRTPAPPPLAAKQVVVKKPKNPLFEKRPKNFGIGQDVLPSRINLGRYVKWPKYVRLQRQRKILLVRLKVPPAINQFRLPMDASTTSSLFKLMSKYKPETSIQKAQRLAELGEASEAGRDATRTKKPICLKFGINHVTELVEQKKASLVVIAHDVDPIELIVWLPALCRKMDVPYCIIRSSARLGTVVHQKTATAVAFTQVRPEDKSELTKIIESCNSSFAERYEDVRKRWGGGIMGIKSNHKSEKKRKALAAEEAKRIGT
ncbi:60S ribosomal protein L7a [Gracilaria domingensis]|nr:60S ribosomal protein L7a [Gracilaria domingensis]